MSPALRTLPLHVEPFDGESTISWLIALAACHHTSVRELLLERGLVEPYRAVPAVEDTISDELAAALAYISHLDTQQIIDLTVERQYPRPHPSLYLRYGQDAEMTVRQTFWRIRPTYKFCPHCLADSDGRWLQKWRSNFTFCCAIHRCLLIDTCPSCGALIKLGRRLADSLDGTRCRGMARNADRPVCGELLTSCPTTSYREDHPIIAAQAYIDTLINASVSKVGNGDAAEIYHKLTDVTKLTLDIVNNLDPEDVVSDYLDGASAEAAIALRANGNRDRYVPLSAVPTGYYACAAARAVRILTADQLVGAHALANALAGFVRNPTAPPTAVPDDWAYRSDRLDGLYWRARADEIRPLERLRYRIYSDKPSKPDGGNLQARAQRLPSILWPNWTLRLMPTNLTATLARKALSTAVLLTGTTAECRDAQAELALVRTHHHILSSLFDGLRLDGILTDALTAITRIADFLDTHEVQIDYDRRRALDTSELLSEVDWQRCCDQAGCSSGATVALNNARRFLDHRVTTATLNGTTHRRSPAPPAFLRGLTPDLLAALDHHTSQFLQTRGIVEPLTWSPPLDIISDLTLQAWDPPDDRYLTSLLHIDNRTSASAADALGIRERSLDLYLLDHPAPAAPELPKRKRPERRPRTLYIERVLSRERLDAYVSSGTGLREIAAREGMSRKTIADRMRTLGVPVSPVGGRPKITIPADTLRDLYLTRRHTMNEIGKQFGITLAAVARRLKDEGIPRRARGGASHADRVR